MGYMGLSCVCDSDAASDLAYNVFKSMTDTLRKGLKERGNEFNTNGPVNVALFIEEYLNAEDFSFNDDMISLVRETRTKLKDHIEKSKNAEWDCERNKKDHLTAYNRMLKNLDSFLSNVRV